MSYAEHLQYCKRGSWFRSACLSFACEPPQVGFTAEGEIKGLDVELYNNAGNSLDLSSSIMDRALLHTDNSYRLGAVRAVGHCCFTNQASNTAFRGFGGPQVRSFCMHRLYRRFYFCRAPCFL